MSRDLLVRTLRAPEAIARFSMTEWDTLVRQARAAGLLARLAHRFHLHALDEAVPAPVRWHFLAAATLAHKQRTAVHWELRQIHAALADLDTPVITLKGAAYVACASPAADGRLFNDIDILVPRERLRDVEDALILGGWHAGPLSDYDKRYYRRWMHEIPPMRHIQRETVVDVHHAILPDTARYHPDPARLLSYALPVADLPGLSVLSPEDRILHSATHLFHDGELPHGLRDLTDLDLLLREAAASAGFWTRLVARAEELQLCRSLFYALRYAEHLLGTPVPAATTAALADASPGKAVRTAMDAVFTRALLPDHASCDDALTAAARFTAYVRAHWLRMPAHLLIPHLMHKAFVRPRADNRMAGAA